MTTNHTGGSPARDSRRDLNALRDETLARSGTIGSQAHQVIDQLAAQGTDHSLSEIYESAV